MYSDDEKINHIYEIQTYLYRIANVLDNIPLVIPNGVYDSETKEAVQIFQSLYGLTPDGKIDKATWEKIVEVYSQLFISPPLEINVFTDVMTYGDTGYNIFILQILLDTIAEFYSNIVKPELTGHFGAETKKSVSGLQKIMGIKPDGEVDKDTWSRLAGIFELLVNGRKSECQ